MIYTTTEIQNRAQRLVDAEVNVCLSIIISEFASGYGLPSYGPSMNLIEQAFELASPVLDYEGAAREVGWTARPATVSVDGIRSDWCVTRGTTVDDSEHTYGFKYAENWLDACDEDNIEPYESEVFEHWSVSSWLADKLIAHGEKVDKDFAGMCVWARTTTGQAIAADYVIEQIARDCLGAMATLPPA